jgi:hypothetical protein
MLLKRGLLAEAVPGEGNAAMAWKVDGEVVVLAITEAGRAAVAQPSADQVADGAEAGQDPPYRYYGEGPCRGVEHTGYRGIRQRGRCAPPEPASCR